MVNAKLFQAPVDATILFMTGADTATSQYHSSWHIEDRSMVVLNQASLGLVWNSHASSGTTAETYVHSLC